MNKILIGICSCQRDKNNGCHEHARQGWAKELSDICDLKFFVGGEKTTGLLADEIWLDVPDDYWSLPLKTKAICRYMLDNGYDYVLKADCDTTIFPHLFRAFVANHLTGADLASKFWDGCNPYGPAYFLSRRAAEVVVAFDHKDLKQEDLMVGRALEQGIADGTFVQKAFGLPCLFASYSSHQGKPHGPHPEKLWVWRKRPGQLIGQPFEIPAYVAEVLVASGDVEIAEWAKPKPAPKRWVGIRRGDPAPPVENRPTAPLPPRRGQPAPPITPMGSGNVPPRRGAPVQRPVFEGQWVDAVPPPRRGTPIQRPMPENQPESNRPLPNVGFVSTGKPDWQPPEPKPEHPQGRDLKVGANGLIAPKGRRVGTKIK